MGLDPLIQGGPGDLTRPPGTLVQQLANQRLCCGANAGLDQSGPRKKAEKVGSKVRDLNKGRKGIGPTG